MKQICISIMAVALSVLIVLPMSAQRRVEYFWDKDPGVGKAQVLQTFTAAEQTVTKTLDVSSLTAGIHQLGLRTLNNGWFSATYYRSFYVPPTAEKITRVEYAWDSAPAVGKGTALSFTQQGSVVELSQDLAVGSLKTGMHTLYIRALSSGHFSQTYSRSFYVPPTVYKVNAVEYFFDTDPGVGKATRVSAALKDGKLDMAFEVNTEGLSEGVHHIGLRTLTDGTWSETKVRQFLVRKVKEDYVTRLEYFWNNDPGAGNAYTVDITPGKEVEVEFEADMTSLGAGPHTLGLRAQSGSQGWSGARLVTDISFEGWNVLQDYLNSLHDTQDVMSGNSYTRQFLNKDWHALYVPFSLSYSDWEAHFEVARINAFYQYDDDGDGVVDSNVLEAIIVKPGNGSLKPNHPYLIRARQKGTYTFTVDPAKKVAEQINSVTCSTLEAKYTFTGNYSQLKGLRQAQRYRLLGNTLSVPKSNDEVLPPYRWYLTVEQLGNQLNKVRLKIKDGTTGIDDTLLGDDETIGHRQVFDLSGRRVAVSSDTKVSELPKGVYIINKKKYIVK